MVAILFFFQMATIQKHPSLGGALQKGVRVKSLLRVWKPNVGGKTNRWTSHINLIRGLVTHNPPKKVFENIKQRVPINFNNQSVKV